MIFFTQIFKQYLLMLSIFFIGRLTLFTIYYHEVQDSPNYLLTFIYGLRMDTIMACILLVIPTIILSLSPKSIKNITSKLVAFYFIVIFVLIIYVENATLPFFAQYDLRPNYLFVEYLIYPKEVFSMIFADYKLELLGALITIVSFIYFFNTSIQESTKKVFESSYLKRVLLLLPILILLFIGIRSSFGHRPANNSDAMYSTNRILNEITKNSLYSILYSIYANKNDTNPNQIKKYGRMDINEAFLRVKNRLNIKNLNEFSLKREEKSNFKNTNPKNLVIFVQESIGAQFVKAVGGEEGITPYFNKLSKEGILFKDLYSNGTRSVRGLAGVTAGNYSIPGTGVIKRNKSQSGFFTFSSLLKPYGYKSMFLYGGESRFDNMRGWYLGNGFDEIVDEPQFKNPSFVGTWGVCDEDLVIRANKEFKKAYKSNQKFAALMFSTSNHSPFDFPEGKIDLIKGEKEKSVKNAIKYADFAIGKFIELAKKEDYYKDTIFVIVADHNVRVYGNEAVPVSTFQIPGLILGKDIKPLTYDKIASQPDVLATALDLLGLDLEYPIMGHSIFSHKKQDITLMQFHRNYALRVKNKIAIISPDKKAKTYIYKDKKIHETNSDKELEKDVLAFVLTLNHLYDKKLYK